MPHRCLASPCTSPKSSTTALGKLSESCKWAALPCLVLLLGNHHTGWIQQPSSFSLNTCALCPDGCHGTIQVIQLNPWGLGILHNQVPVLSMSEWGDWPWDAVDYILQCLQESNLWRGSGYPGSRVDRSDSLQHHQGPSEEPFLTSAFKDRLPACLLHEGSVISRNCDWSQA